MIDMNYLKNKLKSGDTTIGTWSTIPSPEVIDIICSAGVDFIIIDSEHGPINFETAQKMAMVCESRKVSPIMRIGNINEIDILRALDIGMHGIQIPNIENKEDVSKIIEYAKFPPTGQRGLSPFNRAGSYSNQKLEEKINFMNSNTLIGINIESKNAINNIDEILSNDDLDIVFIGLYDLSKSMGLTGKVNHPDVQNKLADLVEKINSTGKTSGTIATDLETLNHYRNIGVKYILYLVDCSVLKQAYEIPVNSLKQKQ